MTMQMNPAAAEMVGKPAAVTASADRAAAAFGLSAAIAILLNTLLAWVKDAYDPLNSFMASLTGHHWITHGLTDVALFVILGFVFLAKGTADDMGGNGLVVKLIGAVVVAGLGLAAWFVLV
jgi:hypothetical protein